jgi:integrase
MGQPAVGVSLNDALQDMRTATLTSVPFAEAGRLWLETRVGHIAPRTIRDYTEYLKFLAGFFGEMRLHEISGDMIRAYQKARRASAGPALINKELGVIKMMRERIGLPLQDYQRLQQPKDWESPGRALTDSERDSAEKVAKILAEHPKWKVGALAALLSMKSGMNRCEMLAVKLKHCTMDPPSVEIPRRGAKRQSRERIVDLGDTGAWALEQLIHRAVEECGCSDGEHFLFPFQNRDKSYDPTRSGTAYRAGMRKVFELAGIKHFRPNDFRHDAISKALANPEVPLQAAVTYFGWINPKMVKRYSHTARKENQIVARAIEARELAKPVQKSWMPRKPVKSAS